MKIFEKYLQIVHAQQYEGLDDDMPDHYDNWLANLDKDELIDLGNKCVKKVMISIARFETEK